MTKTGESGKEAIATRTETGSLRSADTEISAFLDKAKGLQPAGDCGGRLIFALDATMSRQPTWDQACHIQAEMFQEAGKIGGLNIKLVYFRGFGECRASRWFERGEELAHAMSRIYCQGGRTQIRKVLSAALSAAEKENIAALVYVGDCMEEDVDLLCDRAGQLGMLGVPMFLFQEGRDGVAERAFREMARLTGGAYCPFDAGSAKQLADLLKAVAIFASGGRAALEKLGKQGGQGARRLLEQLKR
ncbi:VWA domain-containing protein [Roseibium aggregatum]|uniref:VWA domain-containing protein n=1 Tax=Roseibium aggregatum TaxID=187304 RepID=A0A939EG22_9HYPH|nr:VWA domain-containing protein [Roseibium aggregatum]MBN9670884.1 VWA domain-containing protein [Roseibium aggregatum]